MTMLLLLVPISMLLLGVAVAALFWAVRSGQFDDLDTAPLDVLREDAPARSHASARAQDHGARPRADDADHVP